MKNTKKWIQNQTDLCVYCGLCSKNCPTYQLNKLETESPRGRVVAINSVMKQIIKPNKRFLTQIDNCLQCGLCVAVCPQKIPIVDLISVIKNRYQKKNFNLYLWFVKYIKYFNFGFIWLKFLKIPTIFTTPNTTIVPVIQSDKNAEIGLFIGCTGKTIDQDTVNSAISILNKLHISFNVVKNQQCCGNLHYHHGDFKTFYQLQDKNIQALQDTVIKKWLYFNSGCSTSMNKLAQKTTIQTIEIIDFLSNLDFSACNFKPLNETVIIQVPCTHRTDINIKQKLIKLLKYIPKLDMKFAPDGCCGAAGLHMFQEPKNAKIMLNPFIKCIGKHQLVVSTNIGCRLHLKQGMRQKNVKIVHPVVLFNQQLL